MSDIKNKFWLEDINCLFLEYDQIIPRKDMNKESFMNCLTRIIIIIFLIFLFIEIIDIKNNIIFLLFSLLIIIILYYKEKRRMNKMKKMHCNNNVSNIVENFEYETVVELKDKYKNKLDSNCKLYKPRINYKCKKPDDKQMTVYNNFYKQKVPNFNTPEYNTNFENVTDNQKLVGKANPKTHIPPVLAPPCVDYTHWSYEKGHLPSIVNAPRKTYQDTSGYKVVPNNCEVDYSTPKSYYCGYKKSYNDKNHFKERMQMQLKPQVMMEQQGKQMQSQSSPIQEDFTFPYEINDGEKEQLNDPDYLFNKPFEKNPLFHSKYNENVFTKSLEPSFYKLNKRNEPINTNMGITYPQQFEEDTSDILEPYEGANMSNVFDPRFTGYGTSYRSYFDENVGQPRFYYDDINSVKMPNYLSRNHLDVTPFGDAYGPLDSGNKYTGNIHALANQHYTDSMLQFRTELQERAMRKINAEQWQQKMYPIYKH